ncbi:MAG: hypothetical protein ACE5GE_17480 [Phycisphaerae bacterium]
MQARIATGLGLLTLVAGCGPNIDMAWVMVDRVDHRLPEDRPDNWEATRALMLRPAPVVGQDAPDFTLPTKDGSAKITRSTYRPGQPQVLIFASWT